MPFTRRAAVPGALCTFAALAVVSAACSSPSDPAGSESTSGRGGMASAGSSGSHDGGTATSGGNGGTSSGVAGTVTSGGTSSGTTSSGGAGTGGAVPTSGAGGVSGTAGAAGTAGAGGVSGTAGAAGASGTAGAPVVSDACGATPLGDVTFSVPSGAFEGSLSVELSTQLAGAEIRYTIDGTLPTASATLYAGTPIALDSTTRLVAQLFLDGVASGPAQTAVYIARAFEPMHDLPVIVLDTHGTPVPGQDGGDATKEYIDTAVLAFEPNGGMASLAATPSVATAAGIHIRGQSSSNYAKKPYRLELRAPDGSDRDCPMLGMPSESDWVLHAPFPDKALIRNAFVYSLGRDIGMAAPRAMFAEVYLNTASRPVEADDYVGVYLLVEKIKNQKDRLNLQQLEPTDTTLPAIAGGYIFKSEWRVMEIEQELVCPSGQQYCWDYLEVYDPSPWNPEQQAYLTDHLLAFVTALHSTTPSDETTGYPAFLDVRSFATQVILHELTRNLDAYTRSQYFFKDRDGKINAGPLWDYDLTAGVGRQGSGLETEGWQHESIASRFSNSADWFPRLIADPAFEAVVIARWKELRQAELSDAQVTARIAQLTAGLAAGAARNFEKWNSLTASTVGGFDTPTAATWDGQVTAMRDWLLARMAWLDTVWE
jgi:hypothetical protein